VAGTQHDGRDAAGPPGREGKEVVFLNELRFQKNSALTLRIPLGNQDVPSVKAILGWKGMVAGRDYRGVPVMAAVGGIFLPRIRAR
jgi:hypothetical protein